MTPEYILNYPTDHPIIKMEVVLEEELVSYNNGITKKSLQKLHVEQMLNGETNSNNMAQIVDIFGGIDNVMTTYFESNDISLSHNQLEQMHQILTTPEKYKQKNKDQDIYVSYKWDINNTVLHSIFTAENSAKIMNVLYNKTLWILYTIIVIIWSLLYSVLGPTNWRYSLYNIFAGVCFSIPLFIFIILSFNKTAWKLIVFSFDFGIKTGYSFVLGISAIIYDNHRYNNIMTNVSSVTLAVIVMLYVICIASLDAIPQMPKLKIVISILLALAFSWMSIQFQFLLPAKDDYIIYINATNTLFSCHSFISSSTRILAIFLWKQAINAYRRKGRCISITYTPYVQWNNGHTQQQMNQSLLQQPLLKSECHGKIVLHTQRDYDNKIGHHDYELMNDNEQSEFKRTAKNFSSF
eukprot:203304_1